MTHLYRKVCRFAALPVCMEYDSPQIGQRLRLYETEETPLYRLSPTAEDIEFIRRNAEENCPDWYYEFIALQRALLEAGIHHDIFLLHSSAVELDGRAYLFTGPSGAGKSTHARLWRELLGDRVRMIDDDKPLLRLENGGFTVYGTPWNGKHRLGDNISAPLAGICFPIQSPENRISPLSGATLFPRLLNQLHRPAGAAELHRLLELIRLLTDTVPLWDLECTISREAAELSFRTMTKGASL